MAKFVVEGMPENGDIPEKEEKTTGRKKDPNEISLSFPIDSKTFSEMADELKDLDISELLNSKMNGLFKKIHEAVDDMDVDDDEQEDEEGISISDLFPELSGLGKKKKDDSREKTMDMERLRVLENVMAVVKNPKQFGSLGYTEHFHIIDDFKELIHDRSIGNAIKSFTPENIKELALPVYVSTENTKFNQEELADILSTGLSGIEPVLATPAAIVFEGIPQEIVAKSDEIDDEIGLQGLIFAFFYDKDDKPAWFIPSASSLLKEDTDENGETHVGFYNDVDDFQLFDDDGNYCAYERTLITAELATVLFPVSSKKSLATVRSLGPVKLGRYSSGDSLTDLRIGTLSLTTERAMFAKIDAGIPDEETEVPLIVRFDNNLSAEDLNYAAKFLVSMGETEVIQSANVAFEKGEAVILMNSHWLHDVASVEEVLTNLKTKLGL